MFGYIKPYQPELKIQEYETYKAVYCGLCKALGKKYGFLYKLTLSYDFTFLALLGLALSEKPVNFCVKRCSVNPLKKCICAGHDVITDQAADQAVILLYYKCKDQITDEKGLKKLAAKAALPFVRRVWRKAKTHWPECDSACETMLAEQAKAERIGAGIDPAAEATATFLSSICEKMATDEAQKRVLARFGYLLGRYVYLADALDDLEKDDRKKRFNPLLVYEQTMAQAREQAEQAIKMTAAELQKTFELLNLHAYQPILANIVYLGLNHTLQQILHKKEKH